jgi:predicted N-acetyltransferase YhbS
VPVVYRQLRPEDEAGVRELWAEVFGDDPEELGRAWRAAEQEYPAHTLVAVGPDDTLLGAARYTVRHLRDRAGRPRRVGHLQELAVRAAARRQGHGRRLLQETVTALHREGCAWALVLPGPEAAGFYAHHGWQPFALPVCEGALATDLPPRAAPYAIRRYDPLAEPGGWAALAAVYAADSARRPLSLVREPRYWQASIAPRVLGAQPWLRPPGTFLAAAQPAPAAELAGYVLVHWWHVHDGAAGHFEVSELCTRPGHEAATVALLTALGEHAAAQDCRMGWGRLFVPREPAIEQAIGRLLRHPEWSDFVVLQACPVAPELDAGELAALLAATGAICWSLDVL